MIKNRKNPGFFSAPSPEGAPVNHTAQRLVSVLFLTLFTAGAGFAFDAATFYKTFPNPIAQKSILISGGLGLGTFYTGWDSSALIGGAVSVDYALPLNFLSLTVGGEIGISGASVKIYTVDAGFGLVPILARAAWHPNWGIDKLDTYAMLKLGVGIGFWTGDLAKSGGPDAPVGFMYGFDLGVRYFFTDSIGIFAELGYEYSFLTYTTKHSYASSYDRYGNPTAYRTASYSNAAYGNKFFTLGVTFKLGGSQ